MPTPTPPPPLPPKKGAIVDSSHRASSLPSSFVASSPYDSLYDYDDTLPALRRSSSVTAASTSASFTSRPSLASLRSSVSSSTSSLASIISTSFRRSSSTSLASSVSSVHGAVVGRSSPPTSMNRRSSSICWIQDGSGEDETFEDDVHVAYYNSGKTAGKQDDEEEDGVDTSMISTSSSSSASYSTSSSSSSPSNASTSIDLLDAEETSLSYDDSDGEDVAFLFGAPSSSYDVVKPAVASSSSKASLVSEATKCSTKFVLAHPLLMAALVFGASFAAGGVLARRHLLSQLVKVRLQHQTLLVARDEILATHPQLHKLPTRVGDGAVDGDVTKPLADATQELQDQLDLLEAELHAKKFELEQVTESRKSKEQEMLDAIDKLGPIVSGTHNHKMMMMQNRRRTASSVTATAAAGASSVMLDQDEGSFQHKEAIAHLVKTMAYDQFGPDIHDVEFNVRYYPDNNKEGSSSGGGASTVSSEEATAGPVEGRFVVEMADFESNPLSSFLFLQQVDHGLWDDTSFHVNAPHMLLAQPASANATKAPPSRLPEMQALGLSRLPIMEYNDAWGQHEKYTFGFGSATATAGSFFFVNKMDNAKTHDGQACFAQVVEGVEVVDEIFSLSNYDANFRLRRPVEIVSVKIVDYDHNDQDEDEEGRSHHDEEDSRHHHDHHQQHPHGSHVVHRRGSRRDRDEDAHHRQHRHHSHGSAPHDHDEEHLDEGKHLKEHDEAVSDH
jgi:cyclophilin family peptidyl-prolyl cis-trans isomerase